MWEFVLIKKLWIIIYFEVLYRSKEFFGKPKSLKARINKRFGANTILISRDNQTDPSKKIIITIGNYWKLLERYTRFRRIS
jgi:hypothetical protein